MKSISLAMADGRTIAEDVRIADSFLARSIGLLRRRALAPHEGLLLIPGGSVHTIALRSAIDVVFLDRRMRVVSVAPNLGPRRFCRGPRRTARVLELSAGRIESLGLLTGMYVLVRDDADEADAPQLAAALHARPAAPCESPTIQFSLRWPLQRCAKVDSTLGCTTFSSLRSSSGATLANIHPVIPRRRESDSTGSSRPRASGDPS
jgi:uncharacterized membrane protein (UPF0127 family)